MSIPRLPFLYPTFFKPVRIPEPPLLRVPVFASPTARRTKRRPHLQSRRFQSTNLERYGPAIELPPPNYNEASDANQRSSDVVNVKEEANSGRKDAGSEPERLDSKNGSKEVQDPAPEPASLSASEDHPPEKVEGPQIEAQEKPLEKVLQMPAPSSPKKAKPPHLEAPPYVHHFDTYTLVKDLGKGGFTQDQSITVMKAVRSLLAANLDLARAGLVSKSDIENVRLATRTLRRRQMRYWKIRGRG